MLSSGLFFSTCLILEFSLAHGLIVECSRVLVLYKKQCISGFFLVCLISVSILLAINSIWLLIGKSESSSYIIIVISLPS